MAKGLFKLPPELRLMIYEALLTCPDPIYDPLPDQPTPHLCQCPYTCRYKGRWCYTLRSCSGWALIRRRVQGHRVQGHETRRQLHVAVLRVNRQIYFEAVHLLYSENRFQFNRSQPGHEGDPHPFLERIRPAIGALIRHVRLSLAVYQFLADPVPVNRSSHGGTLAILGKVCPNISTLELVDHIDARCIMCWWWMIESFWVPYGRNSPALHENLLKLGQSLEGLVPLDGLTLVVEYDDKIVGRGDEMALVTEWQRVIGLWSERGWKYRFDNLGQKPDIPFME